MNQNEERTFVYFIGSKSGPIKIGMSKQPKIRIKDLQTSHSEKLEILGVLWTYPAREKELHLKFQEYRQKGEWFRQSEELLKFIATECKPLVELEPLSLQYLDEQAQARQERLEQEEFDRLHKKYSHEINLLDALYRKEVRENIKYVAARAYTDAVFQWVDACKGLITILQKIDNSLMEQGRVLVNSDQYHVEVRRIIDSLLGLTWRDSRNILTSEKTDYDTIRRKSEQFFHQLLPDSFHRDVAKKIAPDLVAAEQKEWAEYDEENEESA